MEKVRQHESKRIEICRNCGGTGKDKSIMGLLDGKCHVCNGSGRVEKTTNITITVKSFQ